MKVSSNSSWTIGKFPSPTESGVTPLEQFASTNSPLISPIAFTGTDSFVRAVQTATAWSRMLDLCPQIGVDKSGQLNIIPFKELSKYVRAGDVVSFVSTDASGLWKRNDPAGFAELLKQRGWHAEIIATAQGQLVLHGPWDQCNGVSGRVARTPVANVKSHPRYGDCAPDWNLHIFRFSPPNASDQNRFDSLMESLEGWSTIFPQTTWPGGPGEMVFNPILFSDMPSLLRLGDGLIQRKTPLPKMFCIEWVNAVFCLACCYPLTKKFLLERKMYDAFSRNFLNGVNLLDDALNPFTTLPWAAYSEEYIVESFAKTYFNDDLPDIFVDALLDAAKIPRHPVIMPMVPLLEMRKKGNPNNFDVKYICTAVEDGWCVAQQ